MRKSKNIDTNPGCAQLYCNVENFKEFISLLEIKTTKKISKLPSTSVTMCIQANKHLNIDINQAMITVSLLTVPDEIYIDSSELTRRNFGDRLKFQPVFDTLPMHFIQLLFVS